MTRWNRALATLALASALAFVSVPSAGAATQARAGKPVRVTVLKASGAWWLQDLLEQLLVPYGVRIDPDGMW